jgi:hypothetical protein
MYTIMLAAQLACHPFGITKMSVTLAAPAMFWLVVDGLAPVVCTPQLELPSNQYRLCFEY